MSIFSGVRQDGLLSPLLFNLYVDIMISSLRKLGCGCHLKNNVFVGCIMYADDLLLISASVIDLQRMLDECTPVGLKLGIKFNPSKSSYVSVGHHHNSGSLPLMSLDRKVVQWKDKLNYLGVSVCSGTSFKVDISELRRKFFVSVNSILSKCWYTSDIVQL